MATISLLWCLTALVLLLFIIEITLDGNNLVLEILGIFLAILISSSIATSIAISTNKGPHYDRGLYKSYVDVLENIEKIDESNMTYAFEFVEKINNINERIHNEYERAGNIWAYVGDPNAVYERHQYYKVNNPIFKGIIKEYN